MAKRTASKMRVSGGILTRSCIVAYKGRVLAGKFVHERINNLVLHAGRSCQFLFARDASSQGCKCREGNALETKVIKTPVPQGSQGAHHKGGNYVGKLVSANDETTTTANGLMG